MPATTDASIQLPAARRDGEKPSRIAPFSSVAAARVASLDALADCAEENVQLHGGIGFTWEHPAHLYFKRAKSSELLFGDPSYHRELLAQRIGI